VFARAWLDYVTPASTLWSLLWEEYNG
jgi:hypothetical protein